MRRVWDSINSSAVIKPRRVTVQRSFIVTNKPFPHAGKITYLKTFKNIEVFTVIFIVKKYRLVVYFCKGFWRRYFITCET